MVYMDERVGDAIKYLISKYKYDRKGNAYKTIHRVSKVSKSTDITESGTGRYIYTIPLIKTNTEAGVIIGDAGIVLAVGVDIPYSYEADSLEVLIVVNNEVRVSTFEDEITPYPIVLDNDDSAFLIIKVKPSGTPEDNTINVGIETVERAIHEQIAYS